MRWVNVRCISHCTQNDPVQDGSIILFDTLPGGSQYGMNMGMTLVHEAGCALLCSVENCCCCCRVGIVSGKS